ncbi:MAG: ADP-ribosylglycohydrolase family protein [Verrucomicrobia bacterium]|nr:ADP-ribosylglycohydrolase family protein [Verrucomicrobiota bacterium]
MESKQDKLNGLTMGSFIGDAIAMPAHWYYDRTALHQDYGIIRDYLPPKSPHSGSILWRSEYTALNEKGDILHDQARYWGQRGIHYHQFLQAGENTLNLQLGKVLMDSLIACGSYDADDYLTRYIDFMLTPGKHRDTYVEECHRKFFTAYSRGTAPRKCAGTDIHIGGLAHVGILCAYFGGDLTATREAVKLHISLTHRSPEVLTAADATVRIVCGLLNDVPLREAILTNSSDWFSKRKALEWSKDPDEIVIGRRVSPACYIAEAFPASLYLAWKYADDFESAVISNTNVGGDNCHRGAVLGALIGGAVGLSNIPAKYVTGIHDSARLNNLIHSSITHL